MSKKHLKIKIGTYNCNVQFCNTFHLTNILAYCQTNHINVLLLQEVGLKIPILPTSQYHYLCKPPTHQNHPINQTTGILIDKKLLPTLTKIISHKNGRYTSIVLNLPREETIRITSLYLPTSTQTLPLDHPETQTGIQLINSISNLPPTTYRVCGGDLNECYIHERLCPNPAVYHYPRFLPLLETHNYLDPLPYIKEEAKPTHFSIHNGKTGHARLDRILLSNNLIPHIENYHTDINSGMSSDHLPVTMTVKFVASLEIRKMSQPPLFLKIRKSLSVTDSVTAHSQFRCVLNESIRKLHDQASTKLPENISHRDINQIFAKTSETVYKVAAKVLRTKEKKSAPKISSQKLKKDYKALRAFTFHIRCFLATLLPTQPPSEASLLQYLSKKQKTTLRTLAKYKICICPTPLVHDWIHWIKIIKNKCTKIKTQIRCINYKLKTSQTQLRGQLLHKDRKKFYKKFIYSTNPLQKGTSTIWNETTQSNTTTPSELKNVLLREAKKILQNPTSPPPNPPKWFNEGYRWNAKNLDEDIWLPLISKITPSEVKSALNGPPKAPGYDGVTNTILKLAINGNKSTPNLFLRHLTLISNLWFSSGICPTLCSIGRMKLIPKQGKKHPTKFGNQRPLTLQPEIAKITLRVLATRMQTILHKHKVLHHAQKAYIVGGSVDHCLNNLLNHMEQSYAENRPLFILFHDMKKAFDNTQWWIIKKTFSRFAIPPQFQKFILNYLKASKTFISTTHGPTPLLSLKNSVKQGDPLSGYLYIFTLDLLHELCDNCKTFSEKQIGFRWNSKHTANEGYADDLTNLSGREKGIKELTNFDCEYSHLQSTALEPGKTNFFGLNFTPEITMNLQKDPIKIYGKPIKILEPTTPTRFLGLQLCANLNPDAQIKKLKKSLYAVISKYWTGSLKFQESLYTYQDILLSTLNFTAKFIHIPTHTIQAIDKDIFQSTKALDPNPFPGHHKIGFYASIGFLPLEIQNRIISISESFVTLTDDAPHGETTQIRANELKNKKGVLTTNRYQPYNRLARCLIYGKTCDVKFKDNSPLVEELLKNPLKYKMVQDTSSNTKIPSLNNSLLHIVHVSHKSCKGSPLSHWMITCTNAASFTISGTYPTKDISTLLLIATVFCAENICPQVHTTITIPQEGLVNKINSYQNLTHRQKLKLKNSFLHRRIHLLQQKTKYVLRIRHTHSKILSEPIFPMKIALSSTPSTIIEWIVGAPKYYLYHSKTDTIIKSYPRQYLTSLFKSMQIANWKVRKTHQTTHICENPQLEFFIQTTPFQIRTLPHFSATLNNRLPTMRVLHHVPPFSQLFTKPSQCLLCHFHSHNQTPNLHFLLCPQNKNLSLRFLRKSDQEIESGQLHCSNPMLSTNNYCTLKGYLSTCLSKEISFTNEDIVTILHNTPKHPPIKPRNCDTPSAKFLDLDAIKLLRSFVPK